jgi:hypothetical protein
MRSDQSNLSPVATVLSTLAITELFDNLKGADARLSSSEVVDKKLLSNIDVANTKLDAFLSSFNSIGGFPWLLQSYQNVESLGYLVKFLSGIGIILGIIAGAMTIIKDQSMTMETVD